MKVRTPLWVAVAAAAALCLPTRAVHAAGYSSQIQEDDGNTTNVDLDGCTHTGLIGTQTVNALKCKPTSKVAIVPSTAKGAGGMTIQLVMKKVTCGGSSCGESNHVLELDLRAVGSNIPCIGPTDCATALPFAAAAGIPYNFSSGQALFSNGKNKIGSGNLFGALASQIFLRSIGIGMIRLHKPGSNPNDCKTVPLSTSNGCIDGPIYAISGFAVPLDKALACKADTDCPAQDSCVPPGACQPTSCTSNADCSRTAQGDTIVCDVNGSGNCCVCAGGTDTATCADTAPCPEGPSTDRDLNSRASEESEALSFSGADEVRNGPTKHGHRRGRLWCLKTCGRS